jgi:hypothetical protein
MTVNHDQLERLARMLCESSVEDAGRYDRRGCKRAHWRKKALAFHERATANATAAAVYRACGWPV